MPCFAPIAIPRGLSNKLALAPLRDRLHRRCAPLARWSPIRPVMWQWGPIRDAGAELRYTPWPQNEP